MESLSEIRTAATRQFGLALTSYQVNRLSPGKRRRHQRKKERADKLISRVYAGVTDGTIDSEADAVAIAVEMAGGIILATLLNFMLKAFLTRMATWLYGRLMK